jgi:hypothetical protein
MTSKMTITCGSCLQPWHDRHLCTIPPLINTGQYTTEALAQLADYLTRVVADRRRQEADARPRMDRPLEAKAE